MQHVVSEDSSLLGPQNKGRAETEREGTAAEEVDARVEEPLLQVVSDFRALHIEADEGTVTTQVLYVATLLLDTGQFDLEKSAGVHHIAEEVLPLDVFPGDTEVDELDHIDILFEGIVEGVEAVINGGVETTDASLATKGHHIGRGLQVPVLVAPHFSSGTDTGLGLINYEGDLIVQSDLSQSLVEVGSGHVVFEGRDRLDNDSSDILLLGSSSLDDLTDFIEAAVLLSTVLLLVLNEGILHVGEGSSGPVESGNALEVHAIITARQGGN